MRQFPLWSNPTDTFRRPPAVPKQAKTVRVCCRASSQSDFEKDDKASANFASLAVNSTVYQVPEANFSRRVPADDAVIRKYPEIFCRLQAVSQRLGVRPRSDLKCLAQAESSAFYRE